MKDTDFFISYASEDRQWAEWLAWQLEEAKFTVVLQAWDFHPGSDYVAEMDRAAKEAKRTLAVLSPAFFKSRFTQSEWSVAFARETLLPVRISEFEVKGLLSVRVYIDLVNRDEAQARESLLASINAERAKPTSAPSFPSTAKNERTIAEKPNFPGALPRVWNIPYQPNPNFTGRSELLAELDRTLTDTPICGLTRIAIYGLGGVGKTQLAVEYAYRHRVDYDVIWWVRAEEVDTLAPDFTALATKLDLPEKDERALPVITEAVQRWLAQTDRWLLVFDNARDPKVLRDFLPQSQSGHIIITSSNVNWGSMAKKLEVKVLSRDESMKFLLNRTKQQDTAAAQALASELGDLPLALEQAGAYIEATGRPLADYLHLFRQHQREMLQRGQPSTDYPATVATTWELSFQQMLPLAAELMNLCAFLAPEAIPQWLLRDAVKDELTFDEAIAALRQYSLIDVDATARTFTIHRLVQAVTRDRMTPANLKIYADAAVKAVEVAFPDASSEAGDWSVYLELLPHALAVVDRRERLDSSLPETERLVYQFYERVLEIEMEAFGPYNTTSLDKLAELYCRRGRFADAEKLCRHALEAQEEKLGADCPSLVEIIIILTRILILTDQDNEARKLFERAQTVQANAKRQTERGGQ